MFQVHSCLLDVFEASHKLLTKNVLFQQGVAATSFPKSQTCAQLVIDNDLSDECITSYSLIDLHLQVCWCSVGSGGRRSQVSYVIPKQVALSSRVELISNQSQCLTLIFVTLRLYFMAHCPTWPQILIISSNCCLDLSC